MNTGGTLYTAAGTYTAFSGDEIVSLTRTINFLGGWDGDPDGPIERTGESILDGQNHYRGITISGDASVKPVMDGWTIMNGDVNPTSTAGDNDGNGGGIFIQGSDGTVIRGNKICRNDSHINGSGW